MKLKHTLGVEFSVTGEGFICLKQFSLETQRNIYLYITLDQFQQMHTWVHSNEGYINEVMFYRSKRTVDRHDLLYA